jgi:hypothetical protein
VSGHTPHHISHPRLRARGVVARRLVAGFVGLAGLPWALLLGTVLVLGRWCEIGDSGCGGVPVAGMALVGLAIPGSVLAAATGLGYALDPRPGLQRALLASTVLAAAPLIYQLASRLG